MAKPLNSIVKIALVNTTLISHLIDTVHAPPQILPGEHNMEADRYLAMSDDYYVSVDKYSILYCNTPSLVVTESYYNTSITHSKKLLNSK